MLASHMPADITMTKLAEACDISEADAVLHAGDVTHLILHQLEMLDDDALQQSFADFADDPDASIYEKLLEGLIMRFEVLPVARAISDSSPRGDKEPFIGSTLSSSALT